MRSTSGGGGLLAVAVLAIIAMLVVPLPPVLLDILLAFDVFGAASVLIVALCVRDPLELSAFPSLLLIATLFRLSLDVSATRLILTQGDIPGGVGSVIPAFGEFVMRGNLVVGFLLFVILIVVQLVVVANGAQRVAEVAARFTLDAMPGKQMAIDADLHAGLIDAGGARARRRAVQAEADFYGAMDGAGKFVRGDALAAIIIVAVNLVAGISIGVIGRHLDIGTAAQTFALLSVGNALATTLPAFLLSTAMGIMVTRAASDVGLGADFARQLMAHPSALRTVGTAMLALALVPGMPHAAFGMLSILGFVAGHYAAKAQVRRLLARAVAETEHRRTQERKPEAAVALVGVDHLCIDVGEALLPLLEEPAGSALLGRIASLRRSLATELGLVIPGVRVRDDLRLPARGFAIRVRDRVVAQAELHPDRGFAIGQPATLSHLPGEATVDPVTGTPAVWLDVGRTEEHLNAGTGQSAPIVVDPIAVLTSKLGAVARIHAASLLGRQEVQVLLDHVRRTHPAAVKGVVPEIVGLGVVQRVLQHLLAEKVSVRDIVAILETIADEAESTKDAGRIAEAVRLRLAPAICSSLAGDDNRIRAAILDHELEARLNAATIVTDRGTMLGLQSDAAQELAECLRAVTMRTKGRPIIVCSQSVRMPLARFTEACDFAITVVGLAEIAPGYVVDVAEVIRVDPAQSRNSGTS